MKYNHELIVPDEGLPFKMFIFEGKDGNYKREMHWHRSVRGNFVSISKRSRILLCRENL